LLEGFRLHAVAGMTELLHWEEPQFWAAVANNAQHDEQAALICALTALCVWRGNYTAVGDPLGGYFFLPPWELWQQWAKDALHENRRDRRLQTNALVWINGHCFQQGADLPA